ncbi:MAG: CTP synthase [Candidatus Sungbacteria bacterium RIFCSPLOWO2_02_FULL_47_9]|uniref:CTP synthase n=1 Tax=Candidatus Sungbacteria bacterium RIFCSPHIGHO2_01_FULL_47_32 TaxID=1802264 RepID=A0A1G2K389_9BACT|nr:MAG: CTP synthetase [Parcubacteria group bacterium GW2011_GWA2_47_10]OGZ93633.1 MAG: CTP synthase [Candidatus Sungbacteria bacterium RIFCSPHIGHO2_01_FULL_47_32]OHA05474.1 MAG: CTP synthase [Candidatus Sungbacteria bacterium RIFCSPLOWO2_01_FULL_47_32]OHA11576.1 MAG: CTP synthase [Candidatus Sungbacteria bacterium RIFCSPLOWO2_02_FULL_47_9]
MTKYIFVCGGVMSGIGKGVSTSSIGRILKSRGFRVTAVKIDPYINVDAGTMNPIEHGEVFVTEDGVECDQDVGNYERFLDENLPRDNYMTTGLIYQTVIQRERNLEYGGRCVETIPHIPEEVIRRLERAGKKAKAELVLIEIGGTVGEYQNALFLEAGRIMRLTHPKDVLFVLVSYLPVPKMIGEMKTKPTQYAVRSMNYAGIQPDIIIARSVMPLDEPRKRKISIFCNVSPEDVISAPDITTIYEVPVNFEKERLGDRLLSKFELRSRKKNNKDWERLVRKIRRANRVVTIGIIGKYFGTGSFTLADSYISVIEALKHAIWAGGGKPELVWLNAEKYEKDPKSLKELKEFDGIVVPGGFGARGVEGKIKAIEYVRKNKVPFLGLCYGLQLAVVEFARHIARMPGANTTEVAPKTKYPVVDTLPEQLINISEKHLGGSMRLGAYTCEVKKGTHAYRAYKTKLVSERHRHRYEVNNDFRETLEARGLIVSGVNPERNLVEIVELKNHPFFVGTQFHPEFKSRPLNPHPLFREFIRAAAKKRK